MSNVRKISYVLVPATAGAVSVVYGRMLTRCVDIAGDIGTSFPCPQDAVVFVCTVVGLCAINSCAIWLLGRRRNPDGEKCLEWLERPFRISGWLVTWIIIFAVWLPVFFAYYPTIWSYDVMRQIPLETGLGYTTHHPLIHTILIQGFISLGKCLTGGYEVGMVMLSLFQMTVLSGIFSYCIERLRQLELNKVQYVLVLAFFCLIPFNPIMAISQTKDALFAGCLALLFFFTEDIMCSQPRKGTIAGFVVASVFFILLRNNALCVYVCLLVIIAICRRRIVCKWLLKLGTLSLLFALLFNQLLCFVTGAKPLSPLEPYSVPIQCVTGVAIKHQEIVPEYGTGDSMYDGLMWRDSYPKDIEESVSPQLADVAKGYFYSSMRTIGEFDPVHLLLVFFEQLVEHPHDMFDFWGLLSKGCWDPLDTSHAHVYDNLGERQGYLITDYKGSDLLGSRPQSMFPWLEEVLESVATRNVHQKLPLLAILFAPATYLWMCILQTMLALYFKTKPIGSLIIILYFCTLLLGPAALVRYMWPIMVIAPLSLLRTVLVICKKRGMVMARK